MCSTSGNSSGEHLSDVSRRVERLCWPEDARCRWKRWAKQTEESDFRISPWYLDGRVVSLLGLAHSQVLLPAGDETTKGYDKIGTSPCACFCLPLQITGVNYNDMLGVTALESAVSILRTTEYHSSTTKCNKP